MPSRGAPQPTGQESDRQQQSGERYQDDESPQHQQENEGREQRDRERQHGEAEGSDSRDMNAMSAAEHAFGSGARITRRNDLRFDAGAFSACYGFLVHYVRDGGCSAHVGMVALTHNGTDAGERRPWSATNSRITASPYPHTDDWNPTLEPTEYVARPPTHARCGGRQG
jgi:hypothetical protein